MKYFTREWYKLCKMMSAHLGLEEDKQAESFSEQYFQELYNQKLTEFLTQLQLVHEEIALKHQNFKESNIKHESFDREKVSENFQQSFLDNQQRIINNFPEEILKKIADIRVFALNKATRPVIEDVTQLCQDNEKLVMKTIADYREYFKEVSKTLDKNVINEINFHDCLVTGVEESEKTLTISFDSSGSFTNITKMHLDNYEILKQDASLENSWCVNDEIYQTNGKYELHIMLRNKKNRLIEFIVSAENLSFEH
ncbi:hypothetical protein Desor_2757 [Desulfosporosinus orientis DSM 765]|uniref:DUF4085 family protein n=1 Tax=Desulfosporosinus orientis (strain ATCC 19365 / DSM 765 / NCIMB 8382 / VKM B-1628 / Singapore I) TaxID=768706 RepID=G7WBG8_DESOD|nr:DUF4085 family protein [Desulfosporosinus orientis]AET68297.1 hypothetical protein Desor_2757 [Desulfosporosinus orientis DSM 765]